MDARIDRARSLLDYQRLIPVGKPDTWLAAGRKSDAYEVKKGAFGWTCTCPDYGFHGAEWLCKHIIAAMVARQREARQEASRHR